jgi:hypothetical protein
LPEMTTSISHNRWQLQTALLLSSRLLAPIIQ